MPYAKFSEEYDVPGDVPGDATRNRVSISCASAARASTSRSAAASFATTSLVVAGSARRAPAPSRASSSKSASGRCVMSALSSVVSFSVVSFSVSSTGPGPGPGPEAGRLGSAAKRPSSSASSTIRATSDAKARTSPSEDPSWGGLAATPGTRILSRWCARSAASTAARAPSSARRVSRSRARRLLQTTLSVARVFTAPGRSSSAGGGSASSRSRASASSARVELACAWSLSMAAPAVATRDSMARAIASDERRGCRSVPILLHKIFTSKSASGRPAPLSSRARWQPLPAPARSSRPARRPCGVRPRARPARASARPPRRRARRACGAW